MTQCAPRLRCRSVHACSVRRSRAGRWWLNPVPVSLCRAMGADVVIAVDLNWDLIGRRASASPSRLNESMDLHAEPPAKTGFRRVVRRRAQRITDGGSDRSNSQSFDAERAHHQPQHHAGAHHAEPPAGDPADVVIRPRLAGIGAMDFDHAAVAIEQGEFATKLVMPQIADVIGMGAGAP